MRALFALGFLAAVAFWPGLVDMATAPRWAVLAVGVPLCLLLNEPPGRRSATPAFAVLAALGLAALSCLWAPDGMGAIDECLQLAILAGAFVLGADVDDLSPLWGGIGAGVAVSAALAVAQMAGFTWLPQTVVPGGLFANKNVLAEAAVVVLAACASLWFILPALLALALTSSKAAFGALLVVASVYLAPRRPWAAWGIMGSVALAAVVLFATGHPSAVVRITYWQEALAALTPFGHGLGAYALLNPEAEFAHNEAVQLAYELGLLALPAAALVMYALGGSNARSGELERGRLVLIGVCALGLFSFPLHMPLTAFAAAVATGYLVAARLRVRARERDLPSAHGYAV